MPETFVAQLQAHKRHNSLQCPWFIVLHKILLYFVTHKPQSRLWKICNCSLFSFAIINDKVLADNSVNYWRVVLIGNAESYFLVYISMCGILILGSRRFLFRLTSVYMLGGKEQDMSKEVQEPSDNENLYLKTNHWKRDRTRSKGGIPSLGRTPAGSSDNKNRWSK